VPAAIPAQADNFVSRLLRTAKADPKKAGVLGVLVAVLLTMWVRMAMNGGAGPTPAGAVTVTTSDNGLGAGGRGAPRALTPSAASAAALGEWRNQPVSPVVRNLFAVQLDFYRQQGDVPAGPVTRVDDGFWDELAKSLSSQADQNKQRQIRTENAIRDAAKMQLQTIVMSAAPTVVIDGEMVGEGSVVAGFRVLKIEARRIIVEREGIKLEIPMK
jgi:hypothetical protein